MIFSQLFSEPKMNSNLKKLNHQSPYMDWSPTGLQDQQVKSKMSFLVNKDEGATVTSSQTGWRWRVLKRDVTGRYMRQWGPVTGDERLSKTNMINFL